MRLVFDDTNGRSNGGLHPTDNRPFFASVFYGGVFFAAFLLRYHTTKGCGLLRSIAIQKRRLDMIKESSWVYEFFYQEKKRHIEVFPLGNQLYS